MEDKKRKVKNDIYHLELESISQELLNETYSERINWQHVQLDLKRLTGLVELAERHTDSGHHSDEEVEDTGKEVVNVTCEPLENYKLRIRLSDGRKGIFDVSPYLDKGVFRELKNPEYFSRVYIDYGTVVWPHEQDIAPDTIECLLQPE